jgi:enamine deaminase RidA (YjgF/YER057c/UK114 family)
MTEQPSPAALPFQFQHAISRRLVITGAGVLVAAGGATTAALAQGMPAAGTSHLRFLQPPNSSKQAGYSHVVEASTPGRIIYVAGQMGLDVNGNLVGAPGDFKAQATQAWENVKGALAAAGAGVEHIVSIGQFMLNIREHLPQLREVRAKFFGPNQPPPASTLVQIVSFTRDGALYEVNAVAVLPPRAG